MYGFIVGLTAGTVSLTCYRHRRAIVREWRWAARDLRDFRAELARHVR